MTDAVEIVLRVQTVGPRWQIMVRGARELVAPLTDAELAAIPDLPPPLGTWPAFLASLTPNQVWQPDERTLTALGRLLRERLIVGDVAAAIAEHEREAHGARLPLRYVVHVFEGEEDGLLPRLPFELLHDGSFWFRRPQVVGVRRAPKGRDTEVRLGRGSTAIVAWASMPDRRPDDDELRRHAQEVAAALRGAGFVTDVVDACTRETLRAAVERGCDLLYVACHGHEDWDRYGRLTLTDGDVTGSELGDWLEAAALGRRVQAALLCACSSASPGGAANGTMGMAQYLASGDRRAVAALGFRSPVAVPWALRFMSRVFGHLASTSLDEAVARARRDEKASDAQWALPLLFVREREARATPTRTVAKSGLAAAGFVQLESLLPARPRRYFTAREAELDALRAWRRAPGAAVLTAVAGEGGVGKTEIARHVAWEAHESDGVPVIWLDRPDTDVAGALATMIRRARPDYQPSPTATLDDVRASMTQTLGIGAGLLVLDDVADGTAVATLTPGADWNVLVTSRDRGLLPGIVPVEVAPLEPDDALKMLARLVYQQDEVPTDEHAALHRLVVALECLPLTIEVASNLLRKGQSPDEILSDLSSSTGPVHDVVSRVLSRSLELLDEPDRVAWYIVAALPTAGTNDHNLAAALDEPVARAARRLYRLRDASLLRFDAENHRYTMHPLARQFARTSSNRRVDRPELLRLAAKAIKAAGDWCDAGLAEGTLTTLARWRRNREFFDGIELDAWPPGAPGASDIAAVIVDADQFRALDRTCEERLLYIDAAILRADAPAVRALALGVRAHLKSRANELAHAESDFTAALALIDPATHPHASAKIRRQRAMLRAAAEDYVGARADVDLAIAVSTAANDAHGAANALRFRANLRMQTGDGVGGAEDLTRAIRMFERIRDDLGLGNAFSTRAQWRLSSGEFGDATADLDRAMQHYEAVADLTGQATVWADRAFVALASGAADDALRLAERAEALARRSGNTYALGAVELMRDAATASRRGG